MTEPQSEGIIGTKKASSLLLEIETGDGGAPARVPAVMKSLAGATLSLEVVNPANLVGWERIIERPARLCLSSGDKGKATYVEGKVSSAKWVGEKKWRLQVGLELSHLGINTYKLLERHLMTSPKDIKELWERYDQVRETVPLTPANRKFYLAGLGLLLGGLILQMTEPRALKMLGWVLWFFGTLGVAGTSIWSLLQKRATH